MSDGTFTAPDLTTFTRLDELGLAVVGQRLEPDRAVLACRVVDPDEWCRRCGCRGAPWDTLVRRLAREPFGWRPTVLQITVRRYRCTGCGHVWRQDTSLAAEQRSKLSRRALRWALEALEALEALVVQHLTVARIAGAEFRALAFNASWRRAETQPGMAWFAVLPAHEQTGPTINFNSREPADWGTFGPGPTDVNGVCWIYMSQLLARGAKGVPRGSRAV